jgi:hypothetical protein
MLLIFIAYAFIVNRDATPVSAQNKRLLSSTINNITAASDSGNTSENI